MQTALRRARARLSALLVTVSTGVPGPVVLSARAGAADTETAAKGAAAGVGGLALFLRACSKSGSEVSHLGYAGTRAASHGASELAHLGPGVGSALDDVARVGARTGSTLEGLGARTGSTLDDAARVGAHGGGSALDDVGHTGAALDEGAHGARGAQHGSVAGEVAEHVANHAGDLVDLAQAATDTGDDEDVGPGAPARSAPLPSPPALLGHWVGDGVDLALARGSDGVVVGGLVLRGRPRRFHGALDARGHLDGWCLDRDSSTHVSGSLAPDGQTLELTYLVTTVTLHRAR